MRTPPGHLLMACLVLFQCLHEQIIWSAPAGVTSGPTHADAEALPEGALRRLGTNRLRHGNQVIGVAFAPNGKSVASAGWDGQVRLWDVHTGKEIRRFLGHTDAAWGVAFTSDGKHLISSGRDATLRLWEVETGRAVRAFKGHAGPIYKFALSPDGQFLYSGSYDRTVRRWELATGKQLLQFDKQENEVHGLTLSRDGRTLVTATRQGSISIWDAETGLVRRRFQAHPGGIDSLLLTADSKTLFSAGWDRTIGVWEAETGKELRRLGGHQAAVWGLHLTDGDRTLITSAGDRTIRLWNWQTGMENRRLAGHVQGVPMIALSPDGKTLASASHDHTVRLWDLETGRELQAREGHQHGILAAALSPDGRWAATAGRDCVVRLWEVATGKQTLSFGQHGDWVQSLAFSRDGQRLASGDRAGTVMIWDANTGKVLQRLAGRTGASLAFSPEGKILAGGVSGAVLLWDASGGQVRHRLEGSIARVTGLLFADSGRRLTTLESNGKVRDWDVSTGKELRQAPAVSGVETAWRLSRDGRLAASTQGGSLVVTEVLSGRARRSFSGLAQNAVWPTFTPCGRFVAAADPEHCVRIWDLATGTEVRRLAGHQGAVIALAFSADGKHLLTGGNDTTALVWDTSGLPGLAIPAEKLTKEQLKHAWDDLRGEDARKAAAAVWTLATPSAVPFLEERLRASNPEIGTKQLNALMAALDDDDFQVREKASARLAEFGREIEPALRKALEKPSSLEVRRRLEQLLEVTQGTAPRSDTLRQLRALEVLERADTSEARRALKAFASGAIGMLLADEARTIVERQTSPH